MFSCPRVRPARHKYLFTNIYQMSLIWAFWERAPKQTQFSLKKEDQLISILYTRVFVEEYRWRIWAVSSRPIIFVGGMVASKKYVKRGKTFKKCRPAIEKIEAIYICIFENDWTQFRCCCFAFPNILQIWILWDACTFCNAAGKTISKCKTR